MLKLKLLYEIEHVPVVEANHRWTKRCWSITPHFLQSRPL